jgi:hypothetical protein
MTPGANVTLHEIGIYDSLKRGSAIYKSMAASEWFTDFWKKPIKYPTGTSGGRWKGHYAAVVQNYIQPAAMKSKIAGSNAKPGRLAIPKAPTPRRGGRISPAQAQRAALNWFHSSRYAAEKTYRDASVAPPGQPMLVRELPSGRKTYFLVPLGSTANKGDAGGTRAAVLIDGNTGAFAQADLFKKPFHYLSRARAVEIVENLVGAVGRRVGAELVYRTSDISFSKTMPFWRIRLGKKVYYVDQSGELFLKIGDPVAGGN